MQTYNTHGNNNCKQNVIKDISVPFNKKKITPEVTAFNEKKNIQYIRSVNDKVYKSKITKIPNAE